ncbi:MAG: hypothetical protein KME30_31690 [Iphinoe sp. HA4291-MV1]|jgi:hypothetical protein|nr:hypothetical protein [Iphinoe sp. HA4291-MV1]
MFTTELVEFLALLIDGMNFVSRKGEPAREGSSANDGFPTVTASGVGVPEAVRCGESSAAGGFPSPDGDATRTVGDW